MREYLKINESNALKAMLRNIAFNIAKKMTSGMLLAIGFFGTTILAVAISGTIKTWTTGEVLKSADLNTTIASLQTAIQNIPNWTKAANGNDAYYTAGKVGIGTASPATNLHVSQIIGADRSTMITFEGIAAGGADVDFIRNSTQNGQTVRTFTIRGGNDYDINPSYSIGMKSNHNLALMTNATDRMTITSAGNIGIGTTSPSAKLHIHAGNIQIGQATSTILEATDGNASTYLEGSIAYGSRLRSNLDISLSPGGTESMRLTSAGSVGIGTTTPSSTCNASAKLCVNGNIYAQTTLLTSDIKFKKNIKSIENALEKVEKLKSVSYDWRVEEFQDKSFEKGIQYGFIAQEVEKIFPELVSTSDIGTKSLKYNGIIPFTVKAIQELSLRLRSVTELQQAEKAANEKKLLALEESNQKLVEDNKRLREDMARLRGTLEDRLRVIENTQMARK